MVKIVLQTLFALATAALLAGCAAYPAMQVAGHAMTGYDAAILVDEYLPRRSVDGGQRCATDTDRMLQRRLRERLKIGKHTALTAHVIDANAYLVGPVQSRDQAQHAIKTAATVKGLRTITCKFYHAPTDDQIQEGATLHAQLTDRLKQTDWLPEVDLRVVTVGTNVVLIGKTEDFRQKSEALAIASEVGGLTEVVDYISVTEPMPGDRLAGK